MVDTDLYPTITFRDPLLFPQFLRTNDYQSLITQAYGDFLLSAYINRLNSEIAEDIPEFKDHRQFIVDLLNTVRVFGWAVVQNYDSGIRVFNPLHKDDWVKVMNPDTQKEERKGIKVHWSDDLNNNYTDTIFFEEGVQEQVTGQAPTEDQTNPIGYLFIWEKGNGIPIQYMLVDTVFAIPDMTLGTLGIAINARQIKGHLEFAASHPSFKHFVYGDNITASQRTELVQQMTYVDATNGVGAKEGVLKEIRTIEDNTIEKLILALDAEIGVFAGHTRLPLSFYLGEKQTGGLGDTGESTDEVKVGKKKQEILNHVFDQLQEVFATEFGETIGDDIRDFYTKQEEEAEKKQQDLLDQSQDKQDVNANG